MKITDLIRELTSMISDDPARVNAEAVFVDYTGDTYPVLSTSWDTELGTALLKDTIND